MNGESEIQCTDTSVEMEYDHPFKAGELKTITFTIKVGESGIPKGGCVKIGTPNMGWGQPFCPTPRDWSELLIDRSFIHNSWKPINTTYSLKTSTEADIQLRGDENQITDVVFSDTDQDTGFVEINRGESFKFANPPMDESFIDKYGQWRWWITATVIKEDLREGDIIEITYGDLENSLGVAVQSWFEDQLNFCVLADLAGKGKFKELSGSPIDIEVVRNVATQLNAVIPTIIRPNCEKTLKLSVLDQNFLPPSNVVDGQISIKSESSVDLENDAISANVLTSSLRIEGDGPHRIEVISDKFERTITNPGVSVSDDDEMNVYWGDLHTQSMYHQWKLDAGRGDSCNTPRGVHEYARECSLLDFVAITDGFGAYDYNPGWEENQIIANEMTEPGKYVAFKGWECGMGGQGDKCVVYRSAEIEGHIPRMEPGKCATAAHALVDFYLNHKERVLTIPHSFMKYLDWSVFHPELDRVIEVYSTWGAYEARENISLNTKKQPRNQSARYAWSLDRIYGITASGDSHLGYPGRSVPFGDRYHCQNHKAGFTAVYAKELTRESVWDALYDRRSYGTTGARIFLDFKINGERMGSVLEYGEGDEELLNRKIEIRVVGTDFIKRIEVFKNNEPFHVEKPFGDKSDFTLFDKLDSSPTARDFYYVRVLQSDGNAAWASPIWIERNSK